MASTRSTAPSLLLLLLLSLIASSASSDTPQTCPAGDGSCLTNAEAGNTRAFAAQSIASHTAQASASPGRSNPSPDAIEALLVEKQRLTALLERSISRVRQLEAALASPSCPCSSPASSFPLPSSGSSSAAAADTGVMGEYTGVDQHTLAKQASAAESAAQAARAAALVQQRAEAEIKRIQAAKQLARATCTPPPPSLTHSYRIIIRQHKLTRTAVYAQTSGARILAPSNSSRLPVGNVNFSIRAPPLAGSGMVLQLLVNDFLVSEVVEDTAIILNDMPEAWCGATPSRAFSSPTVHMCNARCAGTLRPSCCSQPTSSSTP
jgi:hypothetical protein